MKYQGRFEGREEINRLKGKKREIMEQIKRRSDRCHVRDLCKLCDLLINNPHILNLIHLYYHFLTQQEKVACETKLITELSSVKERYREYEAKNEELERKVQLQQEQIYELKEELMAAQAEVKMQATRTEGRKY